jgi:phage-related protein
MGSSKKDLCDMPEELHVSFGYALDQVQLGDFPSIAVPWKGLRSGILELRDSDRDGTYRLVYAVCFKEAVYVLHCFQKKSKTGIKTTEMDKKLIAERLRDAKDHYQAHYADKLKRAPKG